MASINAIKNMVRQFGPETVLDLMFSSVDPVFQAALLSRASESGKRVTTVADMLQTEYVQHAIASSEGTTPWILVTPDGRVFPGRSIVPPSSDRSWLRWPSAKGQAKGGPEAVARTPASPSTPAQRY